MKTLLLLAALLPSALFAATAASYPAKTTLAGTEKIYLDDSTTDKHATVSTLWKSMIMSDGFTASGSTAFDLSGSTGAFLSSTGAQTLNGSVTVNGATTPSITLASGKTNTGFVTINGKTSGGLKIIPADASGFLVTVSMSAQTTGVATLTIPDLANVSDTFVFATKSATLTNKTLTAPIMTAPVLGVATATSLNGLTVTTSTGTLTIPNGVVFTGPSASGTAATVGGTETLINKTISLASNTVTFTSAQLATACSNETGSGLLVFGTSPTLTTPALGVATATTVNKITITAPASGATLTIPDGVVFTGPSASGTAATLAVAETLTNKTLTAPKITDLTETVTATNAIAASESGSVFYLSSATEFASTLPAPAAGLHFTFIVTAAPSGASYTVVTTSSANTIKGLQNSVAGDAGDSGTADDTISFVDGQAVAGDCVEVYCDGTNWFVYAVSKLAAGVTFTQAN